MLKLVKMYHHTILSGIFEVDKEISSYNLSDIFEVVVRTPKSTIPYVLSIEHATTIFKNRSLDFQ